MSRNRRKKEKRKKRLEERLERQMNRIYIKTDEIDSRLSFCDYIVDDKGYLRANYKPANKSVKKPKKHKKKYKKRKIGRDKKCSI